MCTYVYIVSILVWVSISRQELDRGEERLGTAGTPRFEEGRDREKAWPAVIDELFPEW